MAELKVIVICWIAFGCFMFPIYMVACCVSVIAAIKNRRRIKEAQNLANTNPSMSSTEGVVVRKPNIQFIEDEERANKYRHYNYNTNNKTRSSQNSRKSNKSQNSNKSALSEHSEMSNKSDVSDRSKLSSMSGNNNTNNSNLISTETNKLKKKTMNVFSVTVEQNLTVPDLSPNDERITSNHKIDLHEKTKTQHNEIKKLNLKSNHKESLDVKETNIDESVKQSANGVVNSNRITSEVIDEITAIDDDQTRVENGDTNADAKTIKTSKKFANVKDKDKHVIGVKVLSRGRRSSYGEVITSGGVERIRVCRRHSHDHTRPTGDHDLEPTRLSKGRLNHAFVQSSESFQEENIKL